MSDSAPHSNASGWIGLVTVILALVFLFVWPGPLRYEYRDSVGLGAYVKIDRISQQVWDYRDGKWVKR